MWFLFFYFRHLGLSGSSPSVLQVQPPLSDATTLTSDHQLQQQQMDQLTPGSARAICAALPGLVSRQIRVCQAHPNTIQSVSDGARKVHTHIFIIFTGLYTVPFYFLLGLWTLQNFYGPEVFIFLSFLVFFGRTFCFSQDLKNNNNNLFRLERE